MYIYIYPVLGHVLTPIQGDFNPSGLRTRINKSSDTDFARDSFDLPLILLHCYI